MGEPSPFPFEEPVEWDPPARIPEPIDDRALWVTAPRPVFTPETASLPCGLSWLTALARVGVALISARLMGRVWSRNR